MTDNKRQIVIPGEKIVEGDDYLPGDATEKREGAIVALKYGLAEISDKLVKVIPLSGVYQARRGNIVIGTVQNILFNGWLINIGASENGFLSLMEVPRFVHKDNLEEVMEIGDVVVAKIFAINKRGIDLSIKGRGLGKMDEGLVIKINPNKVPRVIGKEGSMINLIKENTGCNIQVGQNGRILIKGENIEQELFAKKAIMEISEKSYLSGLTEEMTKWFEENKQ